MVEYKIVENNTNTILDCLGETINVILPEKNTPVMIYYLFNGFIIGI